MAMKKTILIVDDDARNIFAMKATLKSRGYHSVAFTEGREALEFLAGEAEVAAVLLDMMMPEMDGYEMIPLIKKMTRRRDLPVLAVTAQAMTGDRERCLAAGADEYISKPVDVDHLMNVLSTL
jgi:CheY-like chemotaxis protein